MTLTPIDAMEIIAIVILVVAVFGVLLWLSMRLDALERRINSGPSHEDVRAIRDRLAELSGQLSGLSDRQTSANLMIQSIQQHLLDAER